MRGRAIARPSCVYTIDFGGGGIVDSRVIDDVGNDVALNPFLKFWIFDVDLDLTGDFLTPFLTESIGKFWLYEADTAIDR